MPKKRGTSLQPSRYNRPPILIVLPGELRFILKDGYGYGQSQRKGPTELISKVFQKATTPPSFSLYENSIDNWIDRAPPQIAEMVQEFWLPVTEDDIWKLEGKYELKQNLTNTVWYWVVAEDYNEINDIVFTLLRDVIYGDPIEPPKVPEKIKRLPPMPPEKGEKFEPYQYEAIKEVSDELGINKRSVNRRIREGKSLRKYAIALDTDIPTIALKALNRNISLDQLFGDERITVKEKKKINKLAASYGVSARHFIRVARGQRTLSKRFK